MYLPASSFCLYWSFLHFLPKPHMEYLFFPPFLFTGGKHFTQAERPCPEADRAQTSQLGQDGTILTWLEFRKCSLCLEGPRAPPAAPVRRSKTLCNKHNPRKGRLGFYSSLHFPTNLWNHVFQSTNTAEGEMSESSEQPKDGTLFECKGQTRKPWKHGVSGFWLT